MAIRHQQMPLQHQMGNNITNLKQHRTLMNRLKQEIQEIITSDELVDQCKIRLEMVNDSFTDLRGYIGGPPDTPYEGGTFVLEIKIPDNYPMQPPKCKFLTRMWHPNISSMMGVICLDILKKNLWNPEQMSLRVMLLSIQALLSSCVPEDPLEPYVAAQYKLNRDMFDRTARHWTTVYAGATIHGDDDEFNDKVKKLASFGFDQHNARKQLSAHQWNVDKAMENLFYHR